MKSSINVAGYRRNFFMEQKKSVVQMHIALGHLRGRARGGWGDTRPWGVNMRPFHPKHKSSERLIQFFAWMAELAYREPQYLQILDVPHKTVSQTRAQSARLSLFTQTLNDDRISPRSHIRLYRPRRNSLCPYHTSNRHKKPPPQKKNLQY